MIRPLTIATLLMACSSGLYLYQSKHEVQLLDRTIERTVRETNTLREQSRLLATEWTMLNDPERLRQFSDTYMSLKTIAPAQFSSLADLDSRLPMVQAELPAAGGAEPVPVAVENAAPIVVDPTLVGDEILPVPPLPVPPSPAVPLRVSAPLPVVASVARPAEPRAPEPRSAEQRVAEQRVAEQRVAEQRVGEQRAGARFAEARGEVRAPPPRPVVLAAPRPAPVSPPVAAPAGPRTYASSSPSGGPSGAASPAISATGAAAPPYTGSLLGMARGGVPAAPRPTPVNASYAN